MPPVFIKGNYSFAFLDKEYSFLNQPVSNFGITGLRWTFFDPGERVGEELKVKIEVLSEYPFNFQTLGRIISEQTTDAQYLGIKISPSENDRERLADAIRREGFYPTNYIRKYPRIPASGKIADMPLRAIVKSDGELIVFDIANLSPNGILLQTENPKASFLVPGNRITAQLEPRGHFFAPFTFEGLVCRMMQEKNPESHNVTMYLGIRFTHILDSDRQAFMEVLRTVVNEIRQAGLVK